MKLIILKYLLISRAPRLVARFGQARLVETRHGMVEVRGGTPADVVTAKEWISLFMHEAILRASNV